MNKSGDKLLTAHNLSDLEQETNKTQNVMKDICPICDEYVKTGVQYGYCTEKPHRRPAFKGIPSRTAIHMHGRPLRDQIIEKLNNLN